MPMPIKHTNYSFPPLHADVGLEMYKNVHDIVNKRVFPLVSVNLSCSFSAVELTKLYRMIEKALAHKSHRMVQFISPNREQDVSDIALQTAIIAARLIGQRVLFIDTSATSDSRVDQRKKKSLAAPNTSLETLLLSGNSPYEAIAKAAETELYFAKLCSEGHAGLAPVSLTAIHDALEHLRSYFDMIILDSQAILNDAFGMGLAKLADGSVMIVEAERTRSPVAAECKRLIEASGGHLIGAVMNRRRLHIPDQLYRMLYQRDTL